MEEDYHRRLEDLQSYFEAGCTVYRLSAALCDRLECLAEIDRTLDEVNDIRAMLGQAATQTATQAAISGDSGRGSGNIIS
jgi:hypothetical protein